MMVICVLNKLPMRRLFRIINISRLLRSNQLTRNRDFLVTVKNKLFHIETIYNNVHHVYFFNYSCLNNLAVPLFQTKIMNVFDIPSPYWLVSSTAALTREPLLTIG